jgi:hypothetical protein
MDVLVRLKDIAACLIAFGARAICLGYLLALVLGFASARAAGDCGSLLAPRCDQGITTEFDTGWPVTSITAGDDGNLWFAGLIAGIGKITPTGTITQYASTASSISKVALGVFLIRPTREY